MHLALRRLVPLAISVIWAAAAIAGLALLWAHGSKPGQAGQPPERWPRSSIVEPVSGCANLVMAVHPRCPCTRASIAELARLMARCEGRTHAHVLFLAPSAMPAGWERSGLWDAATAIPGVHAVTDVEGAEAARFGLETSGHVLVFDATGKVGFSGGITDARGHEGDNVGLDAAISASSGHVPENTSHPVFGCRLAVKANVMSGEEPQ